MESVEPSGEEGGVPSPLEGDAALSPGDGDGAVRCQGDGGDRHSVESVGGGALPRGEVGVHPASDIRGMQSTNETDINMTLSHVTHCDDHHPGL